MIKIKEYDWKIGLKPLWEPLIAQIATVGLTIRASEDYEVQVDS